MTRDEFIAGAAKLTLAQLKLDAKAELGVDLKSTTKAAAVNEVWDVISEAQAEDAAKVPPPPAPAAPTADAFAADVPVAPSDAEPVYEARSRTGRPFRKMGLTFGVKWEPVGYLTAVERAVLDKFKPFLAYRLRG